MLNMTQLCGFGSNNGKEYARYISTSSISGGSAGYTIDKPTGTQDGDLLIYIDAAVVSYTNGLSGSGFTVLNTVLFGPYFARIEYKVASSEPTNYSSYSPNTFQGDLICLRGNRTSSPIDLLGSTTDYGTSTTATATGITTTTEDLLLQFIYDRDSECTFTPDAAMTTFMESNGTYFKLGVGAQNLTTIGATGSRSATVSAGTPYAGLTFLLAIKAK